MAILRVLIYSLALVCRVDEPRLDFGVAMTDREGCLGGDVECDYSEKHELSLVERILRTIEQYNKDQNIDPCPACLRDAMLAVAALLHLQSARLQIPATLPATADPLEVEFGTIAQERLRAVTEAVLQHPVGLKQ
jgi:hypothetical protein